MFADAVAAVGRPDIAINTVGKVLKKPFTEITEAEYDEMTAVNSKAAFFFLREASRHVNDNGKICTLVTSLLGAYTPFYAAYAGTKAPVEHYTRAASKEYGIRGISVTAVGPARWTRPSSIRPKAPTRWPTTRPPPHQSPFSKTGLTDIEDVVPFIRFLVSDGWWITGQTILINGGYTAVDGGRLIRTRAAPASPQPARRRQPPARRSRAPWRPAPAADQTIPAAAQRHDQVDAGGQPVAQQAQRAALAVERRGLHHRHAQIIHQAGLVLVADQAQRFARRLQRAALHHLLLLQDAQLDQIILDFAQTGERGLSIGRRLRVVGGARLIHLGLARAAVEYGQCQRRA